MSAQIIYGKPVAELITAETAHEVERLKKAGCQPHLSVILVGDNPASHTYVGRKQKACNEIGIESETILLPTDTPEAEVLTILNRLNRSNKVHGILVQLPLPDHISSDRIIEAIDPQKDVDGFHPVNRGKLLTGESGFVPCTPAGIQTLLVRSGINPEGKHVVIIGRSMIVGLPLAVILMQKKPGANATVTLCHTRTTDLKKHTLTADILVVAAGRPNTIHADMVPRGCTVIDVGTNRVDDPQAKKGYRLTGDVDFESVQEVAGAITPVPGGVGPMTIAMLLHNTVKAAQSLLE
ncbi:bifunctional methylenetetrahydrofolate dehydrogenase/methenyltetrahydrofolate cyclohydrolase FolD [candidate division KSB1 bacterium]|nr:bifunctional methylenetetrahydrofolate dehydrogenase/methenyltetrahydrofolate cyclohydrolase FolD [candidate division KSB1 bacterium]